MHSRFEWESIQTAPRDGTAVLLFHPVWDTVQVGMHYENSLAWQQPNGDLLPTPTHWTSLPPLPSECFGPPE